jgi:hypothetical protein
MSNTFASISNAAGILKIYYAGPIVSQFNDEVPLYKAAEKGKEKWNGQQVNRPLKVRRNPGIGATSDGGNLPAIGKQTVVQATITARYNYLRFGITGPMIKASQGDKGAFASIMEYEMEEGLKDLNNDVNRQLFWNGRGDLAVLSANAVASNTITATGRTTGEDGVKYIEQGMVLDIYSTAGVLKASGVTVQSVSGTTTATIVLDSPVTADSGDILVRSGAYNQEIQGIYTVLDGGTSEIYGINRATYPIYNGTVVDAANAQLGLDLIQRPFNEIRRKGGGKVGVHMVDFDTERYYNKLLVADKRYIGAKVQGDGTFTSKDQSYLDFGGVPVMPDKDCLGRTWFMMSADGWKKYVLSELEWADETGSYMIAQTGTDAFEVRLRLFANMFPEKPTNMARLHNFISP